MGEFYRVDNYSATAYFYLDKPENNLPPLAPLEQRLKAFSDKPEQQHMNWHQIDIWIVGIYILLMLGTGFWHRRFC